MQLRNVKYQRENIMKNRIFLLLTAVFLLSSCCSENFRISFENIRWNDRSMFRKALIPEEHYILDALPGASVYYMDLSITENYKGINGHQKILYTNTEAISLNEVAVHLYPEITGGSSSVTDLRIDGTEVFPVLKYGGSILLIPLPEILTPGESVVISLDFSVSIPEEPFFHYGQFSFREEVLSASGFYPVIAVYDKTGWHTGIPAEYGDYSFSDASFYVVRITAPRELVIAASGIIMESAKRQGKKIQTFVIGPARDFYFAASEKFVLKSKKQGSTVINSFALPSQERAAEHALNSAADSIRILSGKLGNYPYTEYDIVSIPTKALGIEYSGLSACSKKLYDNIDGRISGIPARDLMESLIAHETAHQWFYGIIGNDQREEPWIDESLAQYLIWLYYIEMYGPSNAEGIYSSFTDRWGETGRKEIPIGRKTIEYTPKEYSSIIYGRGPIFIRTLSKVMETERFEGFLRDLTAVYRWKIVTGENFRSLAEKHCGFSLEFLFSEWVYN